MSSWTFAAVLPGAADSLDIEAALTSFGEMSIDQEVFDVRVDEDGLLRHGEAVALQEPFLESARLRIADGAEMQLTLRDEELFMTFAVVIVSAVKLLVLGWSTNLLARSRAATGKHDRLMLQSARASGAHTVLFVTDPPDEWLGEIVNVSGRFLVAGAVPRGVPIEFSRAWARTRDALPEGLRYSSVGEQMDGFAAFDVLGPDS